jgi:REP element-mobilizing transposase RayT
MSVIDDTVFWRGNLPHMARPGATYFVTFSTRLRHTLDPAERTAALNICVFNHKHTYWLHCACVMPDHLHMLLTPYETTTVNRELWRLKSISGHEIAKMRQTRGAVWEREYFDRIMRSGEDIRRKAEYICQNPVRAGLVDHVDDYPWIWREWIEGQR